MGIIQTVPRPACRHLIVRGNIVFPFHVKTGLPLSGSPRGASPAFPGEAGINSIREPNVWLYIEDVVQRVWGATPTSRTCCFWQRREQQVRVFVGTKILLARKSTYFSGSKIPSIPSLKAICLFNLNSVMPRMLRLSKST